MIVPLTIAAVEGSSGLSTVAVVGAVLDGLLTTVADGKGVEEDVAMGTAVGISLALSVARMVLVGNGETFGVGIARGPLQALRRSVIHKVIKRKNVLYPIKREPSLIRRRIVYPEKDISRTFA